MPAAAVLTMLPQVGASVVTLPGATAIFVLMVWGCTWEVTEGQAKEASASSQTDESPRSFFAARIFLNHSQTRFATQNQVLAPANQGRFWRACKADLALIFSMLPLVRLSLWQ